MTNVLEDKDAIRDLLYSYSYFAESGTAEDWISLFADDAIWDTGKLGGRHQGHEELKRVFASSDPTHQHVISNSVIFVNGDKAHAVSHVTLHITSKTDFSTMGGGYYIDELVKQNGQWKFKHRKWRSRIMPDDIESLRESRRRVA